MGIGGIDSTDSSLFRLVKAGEHGLNLSLLDIYGTEIEAPNLFEIIKSLFTRKKLKFRIRGREEKLINRLVKVQRLMDEEVEKEIRKAKNKVG